MSELKLNSSAVIFMHKHPSGSVEPSQADGMLTQTLKPALSLVDIRVFGHLIVDGRSKLSMAERGLL